MNKTLNWVLSILYQSQPLIDSILTASFSLQKFPLRPSFKTSKHLDAIVIREELTVEYNSYPQPPCRLKRVLPSSSCFKAKTIPPPSSLTPSSRELDPLLSVCAHCSHCLCTLLLTDPPVKWSAHSPALWLPPVPRVTQWPLMSHETR